MSPPLSQGGTDPLCFSSTFSPLFCKTRVANLNAVIHILNKSCLFKDNFFKNLITLKGL